MPYQIIDPVMVQAIHAEAARKHPLLAWIIVRDRPEYPGAMVARLVTDAPTPYVLIGDTLPELTAQLPPGLVRSYRRSGELLALDSANSGRLGDRDTSGPHFLTRSIPSAFGGSQSNVSRNQDVHAKRQTC